MKLCWNGLHDKDLPGGRCANGRCRPCRLATGRSYNPAYYATHRERLLAHSTAYNASPKGRETEARREYKRWRKDIAQRLVSKPSQIAALEAELERLLTNAAQD